MMNRREFIGIFGAVVCVGGLFSRTVWSQEASSLGALEASGLDDAYETLLETEAEWIDGFSEGGCCTWGARGLRMFEF